MIIIILFFHILFISSTFVHIVEKMTHMHRRLNLFNKMYARRTRIFFSEQECDPVTVLVSIHLALLLRKSCSVHMTVFEIVTHRNVDNWIQFLT